MNTYIPTPRIITFGCRDKIYVYPPSCTLIPRKPYKVHADVFGAKMYLKDMGIESPSVIIHDSYYRKLRGGNHGVHKIKIKMSNGTAKL